MLNYAFYTVERVEHLLTFCTQIQLFAIKHKFNLRVCLRL